MIGKSQTKKVQKRVQKKAQMEMVGLVVIVILITLGMLFMATFALKSEPQKKIFTRKGLAYSTMSAIMKTTVSGKADCVQEYQGLENPKIGEDIIDDCAKYPDSGGYLYNCIGPISKKPERSCEFLHEMTRYLLNQTLGKWNKNYEFRSQLITFQDSQPEDIIDPIQAGGGCPKYKERDSSGLFPINTEAGLVENVLYLCD